MQMKKIISLHLKDREEIEVITGMLFLGCYHLYNFVSCIGYYYLRICPV